MWFCHALFSVLALWEKEGDQCGWLLVSATGCIAQTSLRMRLTSYPDTQITRPFPLKILTQNVWMVLGICVFTNIPDHCLRKV